MVTSDERTRATVVLVSLFPDLRFSVFSVTSPSDVRYNCAAWAVSDDSRRWWPDGHDYWPAGFPCGNDVESFLQFFESLGYSQVPTHSWDGLGKPLIGIFVDGIGHPTHLVRSDDGRMWKCKLGDEWDIELDDPTALEGGEYGEMLILLARLSPPQQP